MITVKLKPFIKKAGFDLAKYLDETQEGLLNDYRNFDEDKVYILLETALTSFRLLGENIPSSKYPKRPTLYPRELFNIVDHTIPENWEIQIGELSKGVLARDLNLYTYEELEQLIELEQGVYAYPRELGLLGFSGYCEGIPEDIVRVGAYLEKIKIQQVDLNSDG